LLLTVFLRILGYVASVLSKDNTQKTTDIIFCENVTETVKGNSYFINVVASRYLLLFSDDGG